MTVMKCLIYDTHILAVVESQKSVNSVLKYKS